MGLEGPVEGSMRDTQPLCRELIGRRGHGALAPFVTREHECWQREGRDANDQRGKSTRLEGQGKPMQNRYERTISKGRKTYRRSTPFARACHFLQTVSTRHARDTNFTSTSIVIGRRKVTIPDDSRTSVGDIAGEETFLIQSINSIVAIFNNAYVIVHM